MKQVIFILKRNVYWTIAMVLVFLFVFILYVSINIKLTPSLIDLEDVRYDPSIVFRITKIEETHEYYRLEGFAFDPNNIVQFSNYITGPGESYRVHSTLFLSGNNETRAYFTSPISIPGLSDGDGRNIHYTGFYAKIVKSAIPHGWDGSVGILIENEEESSFAKLPMMEINHE